jgi:hypothetical protein
VKIVVDNEAVARVGTGKDETLVIQAFGMAHAKKIREG